MTAAEDKPPEGFGKSQVGRLLGKAAVRLFIFPVFLLGAWVAGAGLHDPDTCWLAALGRLMFKSGKLPTTDPFSYTFALGDPKPFVMYQWLTELIFYTCIHLGGLILLLAFAAVILYIAWICLPLICFRKLDLPQLRSFALIILAMMAGSFHFLVRPEICSYLMLSAWMSVLITMRLKDKKAIETDTNNPIDWKLVGTFCALMAVWCNLHTGCTSGLIVMSVYVIFSTLEWICVGRKKTKHFPYATAAVALAGSVACTLLNPYGINLWRYIPLLFFSPINKFIIELHSIGPSNWFNWYYFPFYFLSLIAVWDCFQSYKSSGSNARPGWFPPVFIATLIVLGFQHNRLIPFSSLCMIYEDAWLRSQFHTSGEPSTIGDFANARAKELFSPNTLSLFLHGILVIVGVLLIALGPVTPQLPQGSGAFGYPIEAMDYLEKNPPQGHGFNTPQFGDVLIWNMSPCPQVFIDTRFDMHGDQLCEEYLHIADCQPGWQDALNRYSVQWVFVTPDLKIAQELPHTPGWTTAIQSKSALLFYRQH
ncbi:MAG TPA: hypothetical protein V6C81_29805 [Planktothrix sp.]|jgi:hypothetical protein